MGTVCVELFETIRLLIEIMLCGRRLTILDKDPRKIKVVFA
jgi:hypothetical protein